MNREYQTMDRSFLEEEGHPVIGMACADGAPNSLPLTSGKGISPQSKPQEKIKICLLGPSESGKSELVKCLIKGNPHMSMRVKGACFVYGLRVEYDKPVFLDVRECRGTREAQLQQALSQKPDVYFLLYDVSATMSFKEMKNKWLVTLYPRNLLTIVIGNKADLSSSVDVKIPDVSKKAWESGHFEISSITGQQVDYLIQRTAEIVIGLEVPGQTRSVTQALKRCKLSNATGMVSYYKMDANPKGICLIISMRTFQDDKDYRYGTEIDEQNLNHLFKQFGFIVEIKTDLSGSQITETLTKMAAKDHSNYDCFVCAVMSHGTSKSILASDGMKIDVDQITKHFAADKCVSLRGKPKIFFVQACRGSQENGALSYDTESDALDDDEDAVAHIPNECDFLIARSTVEGYKSYRNAKEGSVFLSNLVGILNKNPELSLMSSLIILNEKIAKMNFSSKNNKQMPCFQITLRKEVVLG